MSSLYRKDEKKLFSSRGSSAQVLFTYLLLGSFAVAATARPDSPLSILGDSLQLLAQEAEGGITGLLQRFHANQPLEDSAHAGQKDLSISDKQLAAPVRDGRPSEDAEASVPQQGLTARTSRKLHADWLSGLRESRRGGRRLSQVAEAPSDLQIFSIADASCKSVTCGGNCCDVFYTYGSSGNSTCTEPMATCTADDECQFTSRTDSDSCFGLNYQLQLFPNDTAADSLTPQVGFSCPTDADSECSYLNTFSSDMSACTTGACIPTTSGGLNCMPVVKGISNYGCSAAVQTFTIRGQQNARLGSGGGAVSLNSSLTGATGTNG